MRLVSMLLHVSRVWPRPFSRSLRTIAAATVKELYEEGMSSLRSSNVSEPEESSRYLLLDVLQLGYRHSTFLQSLEKPLSVSQVAQFRSHLSRRLRNEPVQYIIGNWDFFGLTFLCRAPVLIPRPETEELVEHILQRKLLGEIRNPYVLDVGAGTGVIGIALLSRLSGARCLAIDVNPVAVSLSQENAGRILGRDADRYSCRYMSLSELACDISFRHKFDLIVSNPPYIPAEEMATLQPEVRGFEDERALCGGQEGLDVVAELMGSARALLNPAGTREVWMEVSHRHPAMIQQLLQPPNDFKMEIVESITDLSGKPRFVRLRSSE